MTRSLAVTVMAATLLGVAGCSLLPGLGPSATPSPAAVSASPGQSSSRPAAPSSGCASAPPGGLVLTANGTPPRAVQGGTVRAEAAGDGWAELARSPGSPARVSVKVGDTFTVGDVTYRLVEACAYPRQTQSPPVPGAGSGVAVIAPA